MYSYSVFGLRVVATQRLSGLMPLSGAGGGDVAIEVGALPRWLEADPTGSEDQLYVSPRQDEVGNPVVTVRRVAGGEFFRLQYSDGIQFVVDRLATRIWVSWPEPWTLDDATTYLLGPVFAFALRLRGVTSLHASAVAIGARAIALVGPPGAGKSTLAASFARRGHPVMSDDVAALSHRDQQFFVQPGPPRIRLWPDSVLALYGSADALPRLTLTWEKRFLDLTQNGCRYQHEPLPLAAIYLLTERRADRALCAEGLSSVASLMALIANTNANHLLDENMRAQEFECLSLVVSAVPIRRLVLDDNQALISRVCDIIVDDLQGLKADRGLHV